MPLPDDFWDDPSEAPVVEPPPPVEKPQKTIRFTVLKSRPQFFEASWVFNPVINPCGENALDNFAPCTLGAESSDASA